MDSLCVCARVHIINSFIPGQPIIAWCLLVLMMMMMIVSSSKNDDHRPRSRSLEKVYSSHENPRIPPLSTRSVCFKWPFESEQTRIFLSYSTNTLFLISSLKNRKRGIQPTDKDHEGNKTK